MNCIREIKLKYFTSLILHISYLIPHYSIFQAQDDCSLFNRPIELVDAERKCETEIKFNDESAVSEYQKINFISII